MNSTEIAERIEYERGRLGESREPVLVGIASMFLSLCTLVVLLRGLVKHNRKIKLEADDYLCFVAYLSFVGFCITTYMMATSHVGRHTLFVQELDTAEQINIAIRNLMVSQQWLHLITITLIKLSILLLYRRIFTNLVKWFNMLWWACIASTAMYFFIYVILIPLQGYPCPLDDRTDLECPFPPPSERYFAPGGAGNASMDLVILLLPIAMVWTLQMSKQNKSALIGVFILGSAAVAVSFARVPVVNQYYVGPDPIYDQVRPVLFALAESGTAIICACLPVLRPLLQPSTYKDWFSKVSSGGSNSSSMDVRRGSDNTSPSNSKRDRNPSSASAEMQLRDAGNLVNLKPQVWSPV